MGNKGLSNGGDVVETSREVSRVKATLRISRMLGAIYCRILRLQPYSEGSNFQSIQNKEYDSSRIHTFPYAYGTLLFTINEGLKKKKKNVIFCIYLMMIRLFLLPNNIFFSDIQLT